MGEAGGERERETKGEGMKREGGRQRFRRIVEVFDSVDWMVTRVEKDMIPSVCLHGMSGKRKQQADAVTRIIHGPTGAMTSLKMLDPQRGKMQRRVHPLVEQIDPLQFKKGERLTVSCGSQLTSSPPAARPNFYRVSPLAPSSLFLSL